MNDDASPTLNLLVRTIRYEAPDVVAIELISPDGASLPAYEAGAHIDLALPNGLARSYSLFETSDHTSYWVAVLRDRASRGGSTWIHEQLRPGAVLPVAAPSNNFPIVDLAGPTVLIAGGIGVTPVLAQLRALVDAGNPSVSMLYAVRSRADAAFLPEIERLAEAGGVDLTIHADDEAGGPPDLNGYLGRYSGGDERSVDAYCCGPTPMLDAFEAACAELNIENAHIERFAGVDVGPADDAVSGFQVELRISGITLDVAVNQSILEQVRAAGIPAPYSCQEGVCGTCEVPVLDGVPDHRDGVLSPDEKESNETMMICVSGSKSPVLVIEM